ncbi:MAG: TIM barrel protein [Planctomycetaceae bacterium]|nr:TIM barrel protein [Planctomycetaceae bacterium]
MSQPLNRRNFISQSAQGAAVAATLAGLGTRLHAADEVVGEVAQGVRHSVCRWCYSGISLEDLCRAGKQFGLQSVELLQPEEVESIRKFDLTCAIVSGPSAKADDGKTVGGITAGWNRPQYHDVLIQAYKAQLKKCADLGLKNLICFSGNRDGMSDAEGAENCAKGLKRLLPFAEELGITLTMELLNSKVDHHDYMCDRTEWGVDLCERIGSGHFKLLYDIYHMQIMEGDVIATIRKHHSWISHYHTGGVPGRNEIDETQELNYPAIIRAIQDTGYQGFVGQEFIPKRDDKLASLEQGVKICSVEIG